MPFWTSAKTPGMGMDAPTWRGAYDRQITLNKTSATASDAGELLNALELSAQEGGIRLYSTHH